MPCSAAVGYQCLEEPWFLHHQGDVNGNGKEAEIQAWSI